MTKINIKVKEKAINLLNAKKKEFNFIERAIFLKAKELIRTHENMGNAPEVIAHVAFLHSNKILNKYHYENKDIFPLSPKKKNVVKYWYEKFKNMYFDKLFPLNRGKEIINSINTIGNCSLSSEFKDFSNLMLESSFNRFYDLNINMAVGLSFLLAAAYFKDISLDSREVCKTLHLKLGELLVNYFKIKHRPGEFNPKSIIKRNPSYVDLINYNLIRIGDHLTFDLEQRIEEDAEIIEHLRVKHDNREMSFKEWAYKVKKIKDCNFASNSYIYHRETQLSLKILSDLITLE